MSDLPFAGYDRLGVRQLLDSFSTHTQVELEAIEKYERSHEDRKAVLDKLRYMRGAEPVSGYDTLEAAEIVTMLEQTDLPTIKRVRNYERKFRNRADVLDEAVRAQGVAIASRPKTAAPAYRAASAPPNA